MSRRLLQATAAALLLLVRMAVADDDSCGKDCAPSPAPTPMPTTNCTGLSGVRVKVVEVHSTGSTCYDVQADDDWGWFDEGEVDLFVKVSMGTMVETTATVDNSAVAVFDEELDFGCQSQSTPLTLEVYDVDSSSWGSDVNELCFTATSDDWL